MIDPEEVEAHCGLARVLDDAIMRTTGKPFARLELQEFMGMDSAAADISSSVHALKEKYERPQNRLVREKTAAAFHAAARRRDPAWAALVPAVGSPWRGVMMERYAI